MCDLVSGGSLPIEMSMGMCGHICILFSSPLYDKVCFSASNFMNSPPFHSSPYFNSPLNLQFRH